MFICKRIFCRIFQLGLRLAIPFLPYRKPEILSQTGSLPDILKKKGIRSVLLVTDAGIRKLGLTAGLEQSLAQAGIACAVYPGTVANPTTRNVEEAAALYREHRCNGIIGFGGGSSIDCAKALGARIARPGKPLAKMEGILHVRKKIPFLAAVPTTAGTGSEATLAAVITDSETRHKYAINDFPLIPACAVLEPELTTGLPPALTAQTGMDALTHAVEAYIGRATTGETRRDAVLAVRLIFGNLVQAFEHGSDLAARRNLLLAAFHAGSAFSKSYVGYIHAIAHSLGGKYDTPHGLANAVILPAVLEAYGKAAQKKLGRLAIQAGLTPPDTPEAEAAALFLARIKELKRRLGIGDTIPEIRTEDIPQLARWADKEANPLYPVPRLMDAGELAAFYFRLAGKE